MFQICLKTCFRHGLETFQIRFRRVAGVALPCSARVHAEGHQPEDCFPLAFKPHAQQGRPTDMRLIDFKWPVLLDTPRLIPNGTARPYEEDRQPVDSFPLVLKPRAQQGRLTDTVLIVAFQMAQLLSMIHLAPEDSNAAH